MTVTPLALPSGTIDVFDSGGDGPPIVFGHGLVMDHTQWTGVIDRLVSDYRCVVPVLPLGGHRRPMPAGADLTMRGNALRIAEAIEALDLAPVVLVANDWGGPQITAVEHPELIAGMVLTAEEAFDNYPPGLPGAFAALSCRLPGGLVVAGRSLRIPGFQRLPMTFGRMTVRPIPKEIIRGWTEGLINERGVRDDVRRYVATTPKGCLIEAAEGLRDFDKPALVLWPTDGRTMPRDHGRRLAELLPQGRLVEVEDCSVLMPLDQPERLAAEIRTFATSLGAD